METLNFLGKSLRNIGALGLAFLGALSTFGLLLALAWLPAASEATGYKLAALMSVASIAFLIGGFISGFGSSVYPSGCGLVFGLVLGLCSFGYVFGLDWRVLPMTAAAGLLGTAGGQLSSGYKKGHQ